MCRSDSESSALVASSRNRIRGSRISARAIDRRWRCPPESRAPRSPTTVSQPSGRDSTNASAFASRKARAHLFVVDRPEAVRDVVADRSLEQHRILRHHRHLAAHRPHVERLHVRAVQQHGARTRAGSARARVFMQRRLARTRRADERHRPPRLDVQVEPVQRGPRRRRGSARSPRAARSGPRHGPQWAFLRCTQRRDPAAPRRSTAPTPMPRAVTGTRLSTDPTEPVSIEK